MNAWINYFTENNQYSDPIGTVKVFSNVQDSASFAYSMYEQYNHTWIPYVNHNLNSEIRMVERYK